MIQGGIQGTGQATSVLVPAFGFITDLIPNTRRTIKFIFSIWSGFFKFAQN